ncbi:hypothetical protein [Rhizobium sp. Leaf262]|uniref:hypothetical protein n=1 Tax=Rhizobium sp. Leaf262 TaxID=1736312 RepID=UPI00071244E4|nr:hypothetical protein [Rhizobium sp. Leaf262]KQO75106.1 hypothetical protein ASF29_14505 [Rhizobium sp. Leaf262]
MGGMKFRKFFLVTIGALAFGWIGIQVLNHRDRLKDPARLAFILNIAELPLSVGNIACSATEITDLIVTCTFEVDLVELDKLLNGWQFDKRNVAGNSSHFPTDAPVGPEFDVSVEYRIESAIFKNA